MRVREYIHYINYKNFFIALTFTTNSITNKLKIDTHVEYKSNAIGVVNKIGEGTLKKFNLDKFIERETEIVRYKLRKEMGWEI